MRVKEERRRDARLETDLTIRILSGGGTAEEQLANLSKGGALVRARRFETEQGAEIDLRIPIPGSPIEFAVVGRVIRVVPTTDPVHKDPVRDIHIQFVSIDPTQQSDLEALIDAFLGAGGAIGRGSPRVYRRFVVEFETREELERVYAENISRGGIALVVASSDVEIGEDVHFLVIHPESGDRIDHDAKVVHVQPDRSGKGKRIGLKLESLGDKAGLWDKFIQKLF